MLRSEYNTRREAYILFIYIYMLYIYIILYIVRVLVDFSKPTNGKPPYIYSYIYIYIFIYIYVYIYIYAYALTKPPFCWSGWPASPPTPTTPFRTQNHIINFDKFEYLKFRRVEVRARTTHPPNLSRFEEFI